MITTALPPVSGPWSRDTAEAFLRNTAIPVRLATVSPSVPWIQSMWFEYESGVIRCVTPTTALVAQRLRRNPECAFEVAADTPPYIGVRGRANATVTTQGAVATLDRLLARYLGDRSPDLQQTLRARAEQEVVIELRITEWTSWDFTARMS